MLAVGSTHIDYLSLDVEGAELQILKTIHFHKLTIDIIGVEHNNYYGGSKWSKKQSLLTLSKLRHFFNALGGYKEIQVIHADIFFQRIKSI